MIAIYTVILSFIALVGYGLLEIQLEYGSGLGVSVLVTLYLFYQRFYLIPTLLLIANVIGVISAHPIMYHISASFLLLHLLFSVPQTKTLQKKVIETKERVIVVEKSNEKPETSPTFNVVADTSVNSVSAVASYVDADQLQRTSSNQNPNLVKRKSASDRSIIEAARLEARRAEEERIAKIIQDRILSPARKEKSK